MPKSRLPLILFAAMAAIALGAVGVRGYLKWESERAEKAARRYKSQFRKGKVNARPTGPTTVFVVMDTVRSDHLGVCGYDRPTSPNLDALARQPGSQFTCDAVAPGSWTLPSHASFFTGVDPLTHRAHSITSGVKDISGAQARTRKLGGALPTLAEQMREQGHQTFAISENPVVSKKLGLLRGFQGHRTARAFGSIFDGRVIDELDGLLRQKASPAGKPLFLFVNLAEAHQPWLPIPDDIQWLGGSGRVKYDKLSADDDWRRFIQGTMPEAERDALLPKLVDSYDYAVWRADRSLGRVMTYLDETGWCDAGCRYVITADHGEFLGEHQLLDHGHYVYEPNTKVPLVTAGLANVPALPSPVSALVATSLVRDGRLPAEMPPVTSQAWPHVRRCNLVESAAFCDTSVAIWDGETKLTWVNGQGVRYQLDDDPGELNPLPLGGHPRANEVIALGQRAQADAADDEIDPDVLEVLRAAGYVE